jgi:hypothetical protein
VADLLDRLHRVRGLVERGRQHVGEPAVVGQAAPLPFAEDGAHAGHLRVDQVAGKRAMPHAGKEHGAVDHAATRNAIGRRRYGPMVHACRLEEGLR